MCRLDRTPSQPQVRSTTSFGGLAHWSPTESPSHFSGGWWPWPHLSVVNDQGSDDKSAVFALAYDRRLQLNISPYWDPAHGSWRDTLRMIKSCGHCSFMLLCMVTINLPHGPEQTDLRFQQLQESMRHHFKFASPQSSPLFLNLSPEMMAELDDPSGAATDQDSLSRLWLKVQMPLST